MDVEGSEYRSAEASGMKTLGRIAEYRNATSFGTEIMVPT